MTWRDGDDKELRSGTGGSPIMAEAVGFGLGSGWWWRVDRRPKGLGLVARSRSKRSAGRRLQARSPCGGGRSMEDSVELESPGSGKEELTVQIWRRLKTDQEVATEGEALGCGGSRDSGCPSMGQICVLNGYGCTVLTASMSCHNGPEDLLQRWLRIDE